MLLVLTIWHGTLAGTNGREVSAENGFGSRSPQETETLFQSMLLALSLGGVPVFNLDVLNPLLTILSDYIFDGLSP